MLNDVNFLPDEKSEEYWNQLKKQNIFNRKLISPSLSVLFRALPKAELHAHLRGAITLPHIRHILRERGCGEEEIAIETTFPDYFIDLDHFRKCYSKVSDHVISARDFRAVAYMTCKSAAEDNVKYLELRIDPIDKKEAPMEIISAVRAGIKDAQQELEREIGFRQLVKLIILAQRQKSPDVSLEAARFAVELAKNPESLVVGFDLAGSEATHTVLKHKEAIEYAKKNGLPVTIHAGETYESKDEMYSLSGAESVMEAVKLGADRIGHGVYLFDNPELPEIIRDKNITVEVPLTANVSIASVDCWENHPIKRMLKEGISAAVCTDNPTLFRTTISKEMERLYRHNLITNWDEIKILTMNGIKGCFLPPAKKADMIREFETDLLNIEQDKYFKKIIDKFLTPEKIFSA